MLNRSYARMQRFFKEVCQSRRVREVRRNSCVGAVVAQQFGVSMVPPLTPSARKANSAPTPVVRSGASELKILTRLTFAARPERTKRDVAPRTTVATIGRITRRHALSHSAKITCISGTPHDGFGHDHANDPFA